MEFAGSATGGRDQAGPLRRCEAPCAADPRPATFGHMGAEPAEAAGESQVRPPCGLTYSMKKLAPSSVKPSSQPRGKSA